MNHILGIVLLFLILAAGCTLAAAQSAPQPDCQELPAVKKALDRAEAQLKDWPNFRRYRSSNEKLGPAVPGQPRVVFMGDSITDFWSNPKFGGFFQSHPSYVDRGISGQTTPQMLLRFRPDVIALRPKAVVILAGTNDIAGNTGPMTLEEIEGNLQSMTELAHAYGIRVVMATLLPVSDYEKAGNGSPITQTVRRPPDKILALNAWIRKFVAAKGLTLLDYYGATVDDKGFLKDEMSDDGLHPNAQGYAVMGPLAEKSIQEALKKMR